jgi:rhodanese-related sulfurtransferase
VKAQSYTNVSIETAYNMINDHILYPNLVILDVREQFEYDENHLLNSVLIPLGEIDSRISELIPYKDIEIVVYCRTGSRSAVASQNLADNHNFTKIYNMLGGITDWIAAGYPVWTRNDEQPQNTLDFSLVPFLMILLGTTTLLLIHYYKKSHKKKRSKF